MPQRAATIKSLPAAFEVVKAMRADGLEWGEGYRPLGRQALAEIIEARDGGGGRSLAGEASRPGGRGRRRSPQRLLPALAVDRTRRHRAFCAAHAALLPDRSGARLCPAFARDRPHDPGGLRARAFDSQARRGLALPARPAGQPDDGEPGGAEPRCRRCGVPRPPPQGALQGADARRRRAGPQDRGRSAAPPGAGGSGPAP